MGLPEPEGRNFVVDEPVRAEPARRGFESHVGGARRSLAPEMPMKEERKS